MSTNIGFDDTQKQVVPVKTLRDYFAMESIVGYFPDAQVSDKQIEYRCKLAYRVADAMLKARDE